MMKMMMMMNLEPFLWGGSDIDILRTDIDILRPVIDILRPDIDILWLDINILRLDIDILWLDIDILRPDTDILRLDINFYRTQVSLVRSMGPVLCHKLRDVFADLTDVILVDEDTNSIPTHNTNKTIQDN